VYAQRILTAAAVALVLPATARAGNVTMVVRDVSLGPRALQSVEAPIQFDMLGLHWQGSGAVSYRTRGLSGRWGAWTLADADAGPDPGSPESHPGWHDGNLDWTGPRTRVQFRTTGRVTRLRAYYLWSRVVAGPVRRLAIAGSPALVTRAQWQADEKIVRAKPLYAPVLKLAIVHHTAGSNDYTPAQSAAIVRGIEAYHVEANGWNDIGYNFLVDRYGTIYEGRAGGIARNVIGAHSLGFNAGTVGIALIGNFDRTPPPPAMEAALVRLLAWRLDVAHLDPMSRVVYTSGGNAKFHAGTVVTLNAISGHRDTGPTDCPGNDAYALLPSIRARVERTGLPKLYSPAVAGTVGGDVRFQARLSGPRPWTVTVADASGTVVARGSGDSKLVDWTWRSAGAGAGPFTWTIAAGNDVLPASGSLGRKAAGAPPPPPPPPVSLLAGLTVSPAVLTPNASGTGLTAAIDVTLARPAALTVSIGKRTLLATSAAAGDDHFEFDLSGLPDGKYALTVAATANGATSTSTVSVVIDRTLSGLTATPAAFSPNGDGSQDTISFGFTLARAVPVQVTVQRAGTVVATLFSGQLGPGAQTIGWDGTAAGSRLPDGEYAVVVTATSPLATVSLLAPFAIDTVAPSLSVANGAALQLQLSEPATVSGQVDGQPVSVAEPAGTFTLPWTGPPVTSFSLQAEDAAGNLSAPVTGP